MYLSNTQNVRVIRLIVFFNEVGGNAKIENDGSGVEDITFPVGNATQKYNDVNISEQLTEERKEQVLKLL